MTPSEKRMRQDGAGGGREGEEPTRQRVLMALKRHGRLSVGELAERLEMTAMGVRRHLALLEQDDWVQHETARQGRGRPVHLYRLSQQAQEMFPRRYRQLASELLNYVALLDGPEHVETLFQQRAQRRLAQAQQRLQDKPSLAARVAELAAILDEDGYLAEWSALDDRTFDLREFNCAIHQVASDFPQACRSEIEFIRALLPDAAVERQQHIMNGAAFCGYCITARRTDTDQ